MYVFTFIQTGLPFGSGVWPGYWAVSIKIFTFLQGNFTDELLYLLPG